MECKRRKRKRRRTTGAHINDNKIEDDIDS
jgi:hypothetical protein